MCGTSKALRPGRSESQVEGLGSEQSIFHVGRSLCVTTVQKPEKAAISLGTAESVYCKSQVLLPVWLKYVQPVCCHACIISHFDLSSQIRK